VPRGIPPRRGGVERASAALASALRRAWVTAQIVREASRVSAAVARPSRKTTEQDRRLDDAPVQRNGWQLAQLVAVGSWRSRSR
jgi:hypothetical protein